MSFLSVAAMKYSDQRQLKGAKGLFHLTGYSLSLKKSRRELRQKPEVKPACYSVQRYLNHSQRSTTKTWKTLLVDSVSGSCLVSLLIQCRTTRPGHSTTHNGLAPSTSVNKAITPQTCPRDLGSPPWRFSFQMILDCVKLIFKDNWDSHEVIA